MSASAYITAARALKRRARDLRRSLDSGALTFTAQEAEQALTELRDAAAVIALMTRRLEAETWPRRRAASIDDDQNQQPLM